MIVNRRKRVTRGKTMDVILVKELEYILHNKLCKTVFQPIISLRDGSILGYEALTRVTHDGLIKNPEQLFKIAEKSRHLWDLEQLCRTLALNAVYKESELPYDKKLFLNVNPNILHDARFHQGLTKEYLQQYQVHPSNIVFEITERNIIENMKAFTMAVDHYKNQEYKIAIDDAGAGYSGLNLISDIHPNYIKLDIKLIRDIYRDSMKYALVKSMVELSHIANVFLIAEGIENEEELKVLINLGVNYGQGYFLQRPQEKMQQIDESVLSIIRKVNSRKNHMYGMQISNIYIDKLVVDGYTMPITETVENAFGYLNKHREVMGITVLDDNNKVAGIITRYHMNMKLSGLYGYNLYCNKPLSSVMKRDFLGVDYHKYISAVSQMAMARDSESLYDFIVVTKGEEYYGIVTVKELLQKATELEVVNAKHQNPLSGLPGNVVIEQKMKEIIENSKDYSILYVDIDNFKPYNDVYGFENGDLVIKTLAKILIDNSTESQFVGHIGGDDFVIIFDHSTDIDGYCKSVIQAFNLAIIKHYREGDIARGFITTNNRHGISEDYALISISLAGIKSGSEYMQDAHECAESLAKIKKKCKQMKGNCYFIQELHNHDLAHASGNKEISY